MTTISSARAAIVGLAFAAHAAAAQALVFNVTVTADGKSVPGAAVYINDLSLLDTTKVDGKARLTVPETLVTRRQGQHQNLRVRAVGYVPQAHVVRIAAGTRQVFFELMRADTTRRDEVPVSSATRGERPPLPLTNVPAQGQQSNVAAQADPFSQFMFSPELVMQHQDAIVLQESQRAALQAAIQEAQTQVIKMQWALALETEKLTKALNTTALVEKEVMDQVDRILMVEREIKRAQMTLMVRIKNELTQAQQARLRQLRQMRD